MRTSGAPCLPCSTYRLSPSPPEGVFPRLSSVKMGLELLAILSRSVSNYNVLLLLLRDCTYGKIERKTWRPRIHPPAISCRGGKAWRLLLLYLFLAPWTITGKVSCKLFGRSVRSKWRVAYLQLKLQVKVYDFPYGSDLVQNRSDLRPDVFPAVLALVGD